MIIGNQITVRRDEKAGDGGQVNNGFSSLENHLDKTPVKFKAPIAMFGFSKTNFDRNMKRTLEALARFDSEAASEFLERAASAENGMEKIEALAWQRVSDKSYNLLMDNYALSLFSLCLNTRKPLSCIGWLASAKVALQIGDIDQFEAYADRADTLITTLPGDDVIRVSVCLCLLYIEYSNLRYRVRPPDTIAEITEMDRISKKIEAHRRLVLERIEIADQKNRLNPSFWKTYRALCVGLPALSNKQAYAERKIQEAQQP